MVDCMHKQMLELTSHLVTWACVVTWLKPKEGDMRRFGWRAARLLNK